MNIDRLLEMALEGIRGLLGADNDARVLAVLQLVLPHLRPLLEKTEEEARANLQIELSRILKDIGAAP